MKKYLLTVILLLPLFVHAQLTTRVVRDSLFIPWEMVYGPDNHIWFTQKNGYICRLEPKNGKIDTLYHETNTAIQSEGGMLGLALHPNFSATPEVFVAYNYSQGGYKERIVKYTYNGSVLQNPQILLDNIAGANFHNGCRLVIVGDKLFATTGDATVTSLSQDVNSVNGKVLRINLDGSIPNDNPMVGSPVWSWGHRNAQGLCYANGKLYESEHGPNNDDEINIIEKGRNYGWPTVQGYCNTPTEITFCTDSNVVEPLEAWTPTLAVSDIIYYDRPMFPGYQQSLIMTTLKDQKLYQLKLNSSFDDITNVSVISGVSFGRLRSLCTSPDGHIYISTSNSTASGTGTRIDKIVELYDPTYVPPVSVGNITGNRLVAVYPNPAGVQINIAFKTPPAAPAYKLVNLHGQVVSTGKLTGTNDVISTAGLAAGVYQLQITDGGNIITREKVVKQ
jgi:glucose/arabinose dehydrogenase